MHFNAKRLLLCQQQNPLLHTLPIYSVVIYLPINDHVKHQRPNVLQQKKAINQGLLYPLAVPISNNALFKKRNALLHTKISKNTCNFEGV